LACLPQKPKAEIKPEVPPTENKETERETVTGTGGK